jgi:hypothetical protein
MDYQKIYNYFINKDIKSINKLKIKYCTEEILLFLYKTINDIPDEFIELLNINDTTDKIKRLDKKLRKNVIKRDIHCILSNVEHEFCDVAHIKPFCECEYNEKYDMDNCLLLRKDFHNYFDKYLWSINHVNSQIILSDKLKFDKKYNMNKFNNKIIKLNDKQKEYLKYHYSKYNNLS